jgi:protein associated with RNAse G/E
MVFTHSRSAMDIKLEIYEIEALVQFHRDSQWEAANKEEYQQAANDKQRADELEEMLKVHRTMLSEERGSSVGTPCK